MAIGFKQNYKRGGKSSTSSSNKRSKSNYYDSLYDSHSSKSKYKPWSWDYGNFGIFEEDKDDELYISDHDSYFTPKRYEIEAELPYGSNLRNKDNVNLIKELSRFFFFKMINNKNYTHKAYLDETLLNEEQLKLHNAKKPFYEDLWEKYIPGFTPLEKAMSIFNELNVKHKKKNNGLNMSTFNPDFRSDLNDIDFKEELYSDPFFNELLDEEFFKKNKRLNKVNILNKIGLIKELGSQFKIEKDITEKVVANSNIIAKKVMRDFSQVFNVDLYQRLFPDYKIKLATKNLTVNVPVEKTEHKQKIIILLDFSGSMSNEHKQEWVLAILVDRLKYAMREEAEVFFSYFVSNPNQLFFQHIKDKKSVMSFWNTFSTSPNGGETDIGSMIRKINYEINEEGKLCNLEIDLREEKPEILIINDGQDSVKTDKFPYKTNAICIHEDNTYLKDLCLKNKGKYVTVRGTGSESRVTTYSEEGMQKLTI